ncbi:cell division protein FtsQ/DivIB [Reinekea marinisedimentorum]|uniref:Cell division protein FtsQ n=1 Tax=Reinekea marinisedimentorum TaxID=230495 RepID=A0A4R3I6I6_9GAMM|nr:cell division protein FtsQ/DivIB [Reinekea marinisedimentorum]TCS41714.1 cell division protein FtsQ [Reinekea marinisedimentorum]
MATKKVNRKAKARGATKRREPLPWKRWLVRSAKVVLLVAGIVLTGTAAVYLNKLDWHPAPVTEVRLQQELIYQSESQFNEVAQVFVGHSLMFVDVAKVKSELEKLPWVYRVSVKKQWPGVLAVEVEEHEPVALWNDNEVLNSDGEPLQNPSSQLRLASLKGPENSAGVVMEQYLQFAQVFENAGAGLQEVKLFPRGSWELKLDNGVLISLGDRNVVERSRRVVRVLNLEAYKETEIEYIDARYSNGISIKTAG